MISAERKSPLNSSTTTVSSFSYVSSCLFPSSLSSSLIRTTNTTENTRRNRLSFPSSVVSLSFPSLSLLLVILSALMCHDPVFAAPSSPPQKWPTTKYNLDKQFQKKNLTHFMGSIFHDEMTQNDEPPRDLSQSVGVPEGWKTQPQNRMYYMRAENDQYLQFYKGNITGTKEVNPPFGIVRFLSHKDYIVILSYLENKYLCMDENSALYLTDTGDNQECYIEELSLQDNGSYATVYHFTKYSRHMFYLGINCDPLLGRLADPNSKASRFIRVVVSDEEARVAKEAVSKSGPESSLRARCVSPADKRRQARAKRQKLKWRWCWNLDRMIQKRHFYMQRCRRRERLRTCDNSQEEEEDEPKKRCVCDILSSMLSKPKRARRKCLVEKLSKWVENQNATANASSVLEASRLLMRNYPAIARRMRLLKAKKNKRRQNKSLIKQNEPKEQQEASLEHTSTTSSHLEQTVSSISHDQSVKRRRRRRRRRRIIKLNSLLGRYGHELFMASTNEDMSAHWSATVQTSGQSHSSPSSKVKPPSVLSNDFKHALNSLSPRPPRRHRGNHKKRKHRRRHHKSVPLPSQIIPSAGNANFASSGASSPG